MRGKQHKITHFYEGIGISLGRLTHVASHRGRFGQIKLFRHPELGKVFVLNGEIQHVEAWAALYHEPLVHLPAAFIHEVNDVLILGGGTLYAATEALKYKSVKRVVLLDHDPEVVKAAAKHYDHARMCLNDGRFVVVHNDAYSMLDKFKNQFDLVINDGADLTKFKTNAGRGHSKMFSAMMASLKPRGVCADVVFRHLFEGEKTRHTLSMLSDNVRSAMSLVFLPEYHGVVHVLCMWGKESSFINQKLTRSKNKEQSSWISRPQLSPCLYYDPRFLRYYLYLPKYLKSVLETKKRVV